MTHSTRVAAALLRQRSLRAGAVLVLVVLAACGKKGPPLAPFVRVPAMVDTVTAQRIGDDVYVSFPVPKANVDGQQPADIASLEVYAITATSPPETDEQRQLATLVATLPVQPILPELPPAGAGVEVPPIPAPPGVDRAVPAVVRETLTAAHRVAIELPPNPATLARVASPDQGPLPGPLVAPAPTQLPRRYYFVIGVSPRGRKAPASAPVAVPLDAGSSAPSAPAVSFTETTMTISWSPSVDARSAAFAEPPPPASLTPPVPVLPPLPAKSLGFQSEATTYHLFEVPPAAAAENPFAITVP
ncbi:MAG: hypothetical protein Q8N52_09925, partial [Acidobacteriota bacterium]|nr:hypothetical protein [Acidobacteriota bacterium]